ncbi:hypothetical protein V1512DRAFT_263552 [Lipomyces arxii]|uniref:uncharacterized protein n=1 Tax=Lipomyces arxii TaxID=56418 RepID=UPI0034CFD95D
METEQYLSGLSPSAVYDGVFEPYFDSFCLPMFSRTPSPPPTTPLLTVSPAAGFKCYECARESEDGGSGDGDEKEEGRMKNTDGGKSFANLFAMWNEQPARPVESIEMQDLVNHASGSRRKGGVTTLEQCGCGTLAVVSRENKVRGDVCEKSLRKISSSIFEGYARHFDVHNAEITGLDVVSDHGPEHVADRKVYVTAFEQDSSTTEEMWTLKLKSAAYPLKHNTGKSFHQSTEHEVSAEPEESHYDSVMIRPSETAIQQSPVRLEQLLPDIFENSMISSRRPATSDFWYFSKLRHTKSQSTQTGQRAHKPNHTASLAEHTRRVLDRIDRKFAEFVALFTKKSTVSRV